jgi:hypothetical protein
MPDRIEAREHTLECEDDASGVILAPIASTLTDPTQATVRMESSCASFS